MDSSIEEKAKQGRFCFQYFDEASDVGLENEQGERVRKRKKPGRKPNPPTQQERREQNRLAQRNFREREQQRRQEREKQWKEYIDELTSLRHRLEIAEYEANYLRGWILQLILSSIAQNGTVPQTWVDTRRHPIPHPTMCPIPPLPNEDEASQLPPMLQLVLNDQKQTIVELKDALEMADSLSPSCPLVRRAHYARFRQQQYQQLHQNANTDIFLAPPPSAVTPCQYKSIQELLSTDIISLNTDSQDVRRTFPSWTTNQHKEQQSPSPPVSHKRKTASRPPSSKTAIGKDIDKSPTDKTTRQAKSPKQRQPLPSAFSPVPHTDTNMEKHLLHQLSSSSATPQDTTIKPLRPIKGTTSEIPTYKKPDDLSHMPTTQALHILRLQLKIGSLIGDKIQYALTPTALQRIIPHDIRIDYVPAGSIRDRMIVFQDYFDMDDCFQLLSSHSMFVGGDIRDSRNWQLDPCVTEKYWFFSHHLFDHHFDDCHIPEDFIIRLQEWSAQQQQRHEQQQQEENQKSTATTSSNNSSDADSPASSVPTFGSLPTPT